MTTQTQTSEPSDSKVAQIIERIKKLLKLAEHGSGATEAEAATALSMAQKLLMEYNLSQVNLAGDVAREEPVDHADLILTNENWKRKLLRAIAEANLCRTVNVVPRQAYKTWTDARVHLIGQPVNRAVVVELFNWVLAQIEGQDTGRRNKYGKPILAGGLYQESWPLKPAEVEWRDWRFGYMEGITERLVERLEEMTARQAATLPGAMALMKRSELAVKAYWHPTWHGGGRMGGQGTNSDGGAMGMGRAHGERVTLHKTSLGTRGMLGGGR